jgi:predicted secreted hydrolase
MLVGCGGTAVSPQTTDASLVSLLSEPDPGAYEQALLPNNIEFPRNLGEHPGYQTEWWYYTGIVATADGRQFGYQFTIFRRALTPLAEFEATLDQLDETSEWRTNQLYLAHFTISDIANSEFYKAERFSRGSLGLAGAQSVPYRVWLEDWQVYETGPESVPYHRPHRRNGPGRNAAPDHPARSARRRRPQPEGAGSGQRLLLLLHRAAGNRGHGHGAGGAVCRDRPELEGPRVQHQRPQPGPIGWDWFSLQFDNGTALMLFQIRNEDGSIEPFSSGSFIDADGSVTPCPTSSGN